MFHRRTVPQSAYRLLAQHVAQAVERVQIGGPYPRWRSLSMCAVDQPVKPRDATALLEGVHKASLDVLS